MTWRCPVCGEIFDGPGRHAIQCGQKKQIVFVCETCGKLKVVEVKWNVRAEDVEILTGWQSGELCGECTPRDQYRSVFVANSCHEPMEGFD